MKHRNEHNPDRPAPRIPKPDIRVIAATTRAIVADIAAMAAPSIMASLRLLILALIADQPRHGYELIKAIEERLGGSYSPSPGVIYPILSWLDDVGYATVEPAPRAARPIASRLKARLSSKRTGRRWTTS